MNKIINTMATVVFLMAFFGIVVVASATEKGRITELPYWWEIGKLWKIEAFKQLAFLAAALGAGFCVLRTDYHLYKKPAVMAALYALVVVSLVMVFVHGVGYSVKGSHRWINMRFCLFQPSEFARLAMVVLTCAWIDLMGQHVRRFKEGILYPGLGIGLVMVLLLLEVDVGATIVLLLVCGAVLFVAGARWMHLGVVGLMGLVALAGVVLTDTNRLTRITPFLKEKFNIELKVPSVDKEEMERQERIKRDHVKQSLEALRNGGVWGVGYMRSTQKKFYLREAHTDFIGAIAGEEFGFVGCSFLVLGYGVILVCGMLISLRAPDRMGRLLAFGMTFLLTFQAAFNLGVVTDMLPTKGIALPFISYGGTSLVMSMIAVGVILNVGCQAYQAKLSDDANVFRDIVKA